MLLKFSTYSPGQLVPPQTTDKLLGYCRHISQGMNYLSAKGFVHRDLAARNVLVSNDGICKVVAIPYSINNSVF